ncbi:MAG: asparagine synthase (glutamine-hydrolyzing) [Victivallales bacterium]|nr:asparagine synthase (glutamine-hydrolyzing) [Victivallales bacterium]
MCGICGIFQFYGADECSARIDRMLDAMAHRGPDGRGALQVSGNLFLGHVRLSIIAPTAEGAQPMRNPATGDVIVYNCEIYNYRELRAELAGKGCSFTTASDTEVLLKAYERWGHDCLEHLDGIYAFAIWDASRQRLFAARDRMGVKPFYYSRVKGHGNALVFASEVRALLASGLVERRISREGIASVLSHGSVQEPFTVMEGVRSLAAGGWLEVGESVEMHDAPKWRQASRSVGEVRNELEDAVRRQTVADVPLGVFLSGGIDSAAIASLASKAVGELHTFTVAFEEKGLDERKRSRETAERCGAIHHELELDGGFIRKSIPTALDAYDQPSIDGINTWLVANGVHNTGMKVALSGLGGDELFAGYGGFYRPLRMMRLARIMGHVPRKLRELLSQHIGNEALIKAILAHDYPVHPYFLTRQIMGHEQRSRLGFGDDGWMQETFAPLQFDGADALNTVSFLELSSYMRSTLLRDADCMGMANSLEIRVPLIDTRLVDLLLSIPGSAKLDSRLPKPLLVRNSGVPEEFAASPKRGFEIPLERILREQCLEEAEQLFRNPPDCGFDKGELARIWEAFQSGRFAYQRLWCIFVTLRWIHNNL